MSDGAFENPYTIDIYDDGKNNILGIYITSKQHYNKENGLWYFHSIIHSPINELRKRIINNSSDKCKHLPLSMSMDQPLSLAYDIKSNGKMITRGNELAQSFLKGSDNEISKIVNIYDEQEIPYLINEIEDEDESSDKDEIVNIKITPKMKNTLNDLAKYNKNKLNLGGKLPN